MRLKRQIILVLHRRRHTGNNNYMYDACDATYFTGLALRNHKVNKNIEVKYTFLSTVCGREFTKETYLESHFPLHTEKKRYKCR